MALTAEQRALRRARIGSSDLPALFDMGFAPIQTRNDLYYSKVLEMPERDSDAFDIGNTLEGLLVGWAADKLKVQIERGRYVDEGLFAVNLDAAILDRPEAIEAKYSGEPQLWGDDEGTDQVPDRVILQCQGQCYVAELARVWVPVALVVGQRLQLRMYCVQRNEELIKQVVNTGRDFWEQHVAKGLPPDPSKPAPLEALKALRRVPNKIIALDDDGVERWEALATARAAHTQAEKDKDLATARVLELLGDAETGMLPDGRQITNFSQNSAPSCDWKQLRALHPAVYEQFVKQGTHRVLRIKNLNGRK